MCKNVLACIYCQVPLKNQTLSMTGKCNCCSVKLYEIAKEEKCLDIPIMIWVNIVESEAIICAKFLCLVCLHNMQIKHKCNSLLSGKI